MNSLVFSYERNNEILDPP